MKRLLIKKFNYWRVPISAGAALGMCVAFLWHFSNILRFGQHTIQEPSTPILAAEIGLICMAALLFTLNLIIEIRVKIARSNSKHSSHAYAVTNILGK